jgi:methyl-accepting chemotaxis protein
LHLKPRSEMNKLLWSFTIPVLLLVAMIVVAYLVYGVVNSNNNAEHTKKLLIEQSVRSYQSFGVNFQNLTKLSPELLNQFNKDIVKAAYGGDPKPLYGLTKYLMLLTNPAKYVVVIENGKIVDSAAAYGTTVDEKELPTTMPEKGYLILDNFGGQKGTFLDLFSAIDLAKLGISAKFEVSFIIDFTEQVKQIDEYFQNQKRDTIIGLVITGIIALILFGLLSIFWLRYLINKHIRKPVEELNTMAQDISEGTFEGEVAVDENSDFAALQGLLKSGQLILRKMDEKM